VHSSAQAFQAGIYLLFLAAGGVSLTSPLNGENDILRLTAKKMVEETPLLKDR
jgi:hypothetical protein